MLRAPTTLFSSRTSSVVSWRLMFIISLDSGRFHPPIAQDARPCERFPCDELEALLYERCCDGA